MIRDSWIVSEHEIAPSIIYIICIYKVHTYSIHITPSVCILGPRHRCCFMFHHSLRGFPIRWKRHQSQFDWNLVNLDSFGALIWRQMCPSNWRMFIWRVLVCKWKKCRSNCFIFVILDEICEARRTYSMMTDDFIYNRILLNSEVLHPTFTTLTCLGVASCSAMWWVQPIKWGPPTTNVKVAPLCAPHAALEISEAVFLPLPVLEIHGEILVTNEPDKLVRGELTCWSICHQWKK